MGVTSEPGVGSCFWVTVRLGKGHSEANSTIQAANHQTEIELRHSFAGVKVLLAEDNPINQEVALGMLREVGLKADLAENGARAIQMIEEESYSLVLMDMQMPEMDGVEAARQIRAMGYKLPIIAMTANAFSDDRERCIQAGMDDFLAKPVVPEKLFETLQRWIPAHLIGSKQPISHEAHDPAEAKSPEVALRGRLSFIDGLDLDAGLNSVHGRWMLYVRMLKVFLDKHGDDAKAIRAALEAGQLARAQELAHALKGSASTLGVINIGRLAEQIELPIKRGNADAATEAKQALAELEQELPDFMSRIALAIE